MPNATGKQFVLYLLEHVCWRQGAMATHKGQVRCYIVLLKCNPFTWLGISDVAHGLHRFLCLLCGVGLCLAATSIAHSLLLLESCEAASGVAVATALGIPTNTVPVSMAPTSMVTWLL